MQKIIILFLSFLTFNAAANFWEKFNNSDNTQRIKVIIQTDMDRAKIYFDEHKNSFYLYNHKKELSVDVLGEYAMTITGQYSKDYRDYKCEKKITHAFEKEDEILEVKLKDTCKLVPKKEFDKSKISSSEYLREEGSYVYLRLSSNNIKKDIKNYIKIYAIGGENKEIKYHTRNSFNTRYLYFYADFKPQNKYKIVIKKGFETRRELNKKDQELFIKFGDLRKSGKFIKNDRENYILGSDEALDIETTNIDTLKVKIYQVLDENINYAKLFSGGYNRDRLSDEIASYDLKINNIKNQKVKSQINLKKYLKDKTGLFIISARDKNYWVDLRKTLIKSNVGVIAKLSSNQVFISVNSLLNNSAISDADVKIYSNKNKLILSGKTDSDGVFIKHYENLNKENPELVVIKTENDISVLDVYSSYSYDNYATTIDLARDLIRPSESLTINPIIRDKNLLTTDITEATIIIKNPSYKNIVEEVVTLDKNGVGQYIFNTTSDVKTGQYQVHLKVGERVIANTSFLVETFIPEKIEVSFESDKEEYNFDEKVKLNLSAKYLFGGSSAGLKAEVNARLISANYRSKNFKEYEFNNNLSLNIPSKSENIILDKNGKWSKEYDIKKQSKDATLNTAMVQVNAYANISDDGRKIRKNTSFLVKPFETITGIKKSKGCFVVGKDAIFDIKTINSKTDAVAQMGEKVEIIINKKTYHYYAGNQIEEVLNQKVARNTEFVFEDGEIGNYEVIVKNPNGQIAQTTFCISGSGYTPFNTNEKKSYNIEIKTDKEIVKAGDKVNVSITSPISGKLILTFEEENIKKYQIFDMTGNNFNTDITIPDSITNGFYLNTMVVRDTSTTNDVLPYQVKGSKYIKLDKSGYQADIKINNNSGVKSNSTLTVGIDTNAANASAIVSIVDNGILNITNFRAPNYFEEFTKKLYNYISLSSIYDTLLKPTKLLATTVGGGAMADMMSAKSVMKKKLGKNLTSDDINKRVKPFVWTSKIITLDNEGKASVDINIPDYNGSAKLKVVVLGKDKIGNSSKDIIIKDDIIIKPTPPRFLIKGDEFNLPIRVFNNTNKQKKISINSLTSQHLQILSDIKNIKLNADTNKLIDIKVKAVKTGLATLKFSYGEFFSKTQILVKSNYDYEQKSVNGILQSGENKQFDLSNLEAGEKSAAYLNISTSPYTSLSKDAKYLISYPHGCAEQTSSKLLALLYAKTVLSNSKENTELLQNRKNFIDDGIIKLSNMQNNSGKFTYWQGSSKVNEYASLYAFNTLKELSNQGFSVPSSVLLSGQKAIDGFNSKYPFAILETGRDIKLANYLYDNNEYKNSIYKSLLLAAVMSESGNEKTAKILINYAKEVFENKKYEKKRTYDRDFYSNIKEIAKSLSVYAKNFNKHDELAKNLLSIITNKVAESNLYSTQDKAFVMKALYDYYGESLSTQNIANTININGNITQNNGEYFESLKLDKNDKLSIKNSGDAVYYGLDLRIPTLNPKSNNDILDFKTSLVNGKLEPVDTIQLGDDTLAIKVEITSSQDIKNIASIINIPAGLEIINERLYATQHQTIKENYYKQHEEYRDDKVISYIDIYNNKPTMYYIKVAATTRGKFNVPSSYIEAMYDSRINGFAKFTPTITIE